MPFEFRIADSVRQFQKDWDSLVPESSIIHSKFCLVHEQACDPSIQYRYVIAYQEGRSVFATCFQLIRLKTDSIKKPIENEFLRFATHTLLSLHDIRLLVVGNVFKEENANQYHFSLLSETQTKELLLYSIETVKDKECTAAILWKEMPSDFPAPVKSLKLEEDISMVLEIRAKWLKWDDYLLDLTKKYAARAKKIMTSCKDIQLKDLSLEEIEQNKSILQDLYEQVINKQGFVFGTLNENYWSAQKAAHKDHFHIKGLYLDGKMAAFMSTFNNQEELEVHYVGIDYQINQNIPLYFYIHFLALQEAIGSKKKRLLMGRTSLEAKAILGCSPVFHHTYIQFHHSLFDCAYGAIRKFMIETENWKTRSPLRSQELKVELQPV